MTAPEPVFRPRTAMVLAAGVGKRMRPLTARTPKPLIEVAGKALIDHGLDRLAKAGVETAVVNVHYIADLVEVHVSKRTSPRIIVSDERDRLLDTGGGTAKALPLLGPDPFFVYNSDSFWIEGIGENLELMVRTWDDASMDMLMLLAATVDSVGYDGAGDFTMDAGGKLTRRDRQRVAPFAYAGVAIVHPRLFEGVAPGVFSFNRLFDKAIDAGRLYGIRMGGTWLHVGTPEAIGEAEAAIRHSVA